jgi:hypothetical protein
LGKVLSVTKFSRVNWRRFPPSAVNYVAVSEALQVSPSVLAAGLAADNVICALYFTTLFALAAKIPAETMQSIGQSHSHVQSYFAYFVSSNLNLS